MPAAKLNEKGVDRADLNAAPATSVADLGRFDVVLPVGLEERERRHSLQELGARLRPAETLKQFLQDQAGGEDLIRPQQRMAQRQHLWR